MCPLDTKASSHSKQEVDIHVHCTVICTPSMRVANTKQLMMLKYHTKFQVVPISGCQVLADKKNRQMDVQW